MMRISSIKVENFKSLVDFEMTLPKFSCLVGLNGAGKSTVLQFIDFIKQLACGCIEDWLSDRKWKSRDIRSKLAGKLNIDFCLEFTNEKGVHIGRWEATYSPSKNRCTKERFEMGDYTLVADAQSVEITKASKSASRSPSVDKYLVTFDYEGSVISAFQEKRLPDSILECKKMLQGIEALDTLTPERLRQRTREACGTLGHGGRNLSAFLHEIGPVGKLQISKSLKKIYPRLRQVTTKSLRSGWKQLLASESFGDIRLVTEASHLNDGLLRMIAILAELQADHQFLLFDEIENGINPEIIEFVITLMIAARQQVLVTTHSPMILNYLDDEVARNGVVYLYKTADGHTKSIPFFSIPSLAEKLTVMGPGEAFVDTNLTELGAEIASIAEEQ
jgi:predicted ATP-dependent endonuclease of OLD family